MTQPAKLVLLPGLHGTGDLFADFADAISGSFAAQIIEYPNDLCLSYPELLKRVQAAAPIAEPYVIVAESFSTPLAIQFAAMNPPNLKGLVLSAGFATSPVRGILRLLTPILAPLLEHLPANKLGARAALFDSTLPHPLQKRMRAAIASVKPQVLMARVQAVVACNVLEDLRVIAVPVLFLQARYDRLVNVTCLEEIQRAKPDIEVVVLDSSHMLLQQLPRQSAEIVADFARRLS